LNANGGLPSGESRVLERISGSGVQCDRSLLDMLEECSNIFGTAVQGRFAWLDGPLITAMYRGDWLVLDNANLCPGSVLDRLNSLVEPNGQILLNERGLVKGNFVQISPHPNFRLIMTANPRYGELSRAMRNRSVEVHIPIRTPEDLPMYSKSTVLNADASLVSSLFHLGRDASDIQQQAAPPQFSGIVARCTKTSSIVFCNTLATSLVSNIVEAVIDEAKSRGLPPTIFLSKSLDPACSAYALAPAKTPSTPAQLTRLSIQLEHYQRLTSKIDGVTSFSPRQTGSILFELYSSLKDELLSRLNRVNHGKDLTLTQLLIGVSSKVTDLIIELDKLLSADVLDYSTLSHLLLVLREVANTSASCFERSINCINRCQNEMAKSDGSIINELWNRLILADGAFGTQVRAIKSEISAVLRRKVAHVNTDLLRLTMEVLSSVAPGPGQKVAYKDLCQDLLQQWCSVLDTTLTVPSIIKHTQTFLDTLYGQIRVSNISSLAKQHGKSRMSSIISQNLTHR